jgi:hypothetical protein
MGLRTLIATSLIRLGMWVLEEDLREDVLWILGHAKRDGIL